MTLGLYFLTNNVDIITNFYSKKMCRVWEEVFSIINQTSTAAVDPRHLKVKDIG